MAVATAGASQVRVFVDALERLGYNRSNLLSVAGLRDSDLDDPDGRIPCTALGALLGRAMQERPINNLGMRIASVTPIGAFPLLDYLVLTSDNVGQGIRQLARYFRLVEFPVLLDLKDEREQIRAVYEGPPGPFGYEFGITLSVLHLHRETDERFRPQSVSLAHNPDDITEFESLLGCPIHAQASWNGWTMSREALQLPLRRRDPILTGILEEQAREMISRLPTAGGLSLEVRRILVSSVAGGDTDIDVVARKLAISPRSLQRQLSAEGISYRELLETTRKDAAERYLSGATLPIAEVAYLLGYSEAAAFHRAFKRWNRQTPLEFRQRHLQNRASHPSGAARSKAQ